MFRFTIRDVLWLMVVVAVAMAWLSSHNNAQKKIRSLDDQMRNFAEELAITTNRNVPISSESGKYIITPECAQVSRNRQ